MYCLLSIVLLLCTPLAAYSKGVLPLPYSDSYYLCNDCPGEGGGNKDDDDVSHNNRSFLRFSVVFHFYFPNSFVIICLWLCGLQAYAQDLGAPFAARFLGQMHVLQCATMIPERLYYLCERSRNCSDRFGKMMHKSTVAGGHINEKEMTFLSRYHERKIRERSGPGPSSFFGEGLCTIKLYSFVVE